MTTIENDVWIGHGAFIRAGVRVGTGAVVAAHAVVVKNVPPYAVVAGNPATIKKFRINSQHIGPLLALQWWRYAAWDLADLPLDDVAQFMERFRQRQPELQTYTPSVVQIKELVRPKGE